MGKPPTSVITRGAAAAQAVQATASIALRDFLLGGFDMLQTDVGELQLLARFEAAASEVAGRPLNRSFEWEQKVDQWINAALNDWHNGAQDALIALQVRLDQEARQPDLFWVALLGNMLWAATVFFPVGGVVAASGEVIAASAGWAAASKGASMLGAVLGSGALQRAYEGPSVGRYAVGPAAGVEIRLEMMRRIASAKDKLREEIGNNCQRWAQELKYCFEGCLRREPSQCGAQELRPAEMIVGRRIFPSIPWKHRTAVFAQTMIKEIEFALRDYNRQYDEWARGLESAHESDAWCAVGGIATNPAVQQYPPFKPHLRFSVPESKFR